MESPQNGSDLQTEVVLEQTLLKVEEVFVYRIPPCPTSGGHRADDWNLANPQATCSLVVLRRDDALLLRLFSERPKKGAPPGATENFLFAQCKVELDFSNAQSSSPSSPSPTTTNFKNSRRSTAPKPNMDFWVEPVVDSSRYFAIRISDEKTGREAHVGIGFRERNDALDFKMSLQEYESMMRKEASFGQADRGVTEKSSPDPDAENNTISESIASVSKLSLKEGEKIHINIKGTSTTKSRVKKSQSDSSGSSPGIKKSLMLLRKPPPPGSSTADPSTTVVVDKDDEDEWGEFESVQSSG